MAMILKEKRKNANKGRNGKPCLGWRRLPSNPSTCSALLLAQYEVDCRGCWKASDQWEKTTPCLPLKCRGERACHVGMSLQEWVRGSLQGWQELGADRARAGRRQAAGSCRLKCLAAEIDIASRRDGSTQTSKLFVQPIMSARQQQKGKCRCS